MNIYIHIHISIDACTACTARTRTHTLTLTPHLQASVVIDMAAQVVTLEFSKPVPSPADVTGSLQQFESDQARKEG